MVKMLLVAVLSATLIGCGDEKKTDSDPGKKTAAKKETARKETARTDAKITTVEDARTALKGEWEYNLAEMKKEHARQKANWVEGESGTFPSDDELAKAKTSFTDAGGLEIRGMTITRFDLKAGDGDNNFTISNMKDPDGILGDMTIGVNFGSRDRLTLDLGGDKLIFDRKK